MGTVGATDHLMLTAVVSSTQLPLSQEDKTQTLTSSSGTHMGQHGNQLVSRPDVESFSSQPISQPGMPLPCHHPIHSYNPNIPTTGQKRANRVRPPRHSHNMVYLPRHLHGRPPLRKTLHPFLLPRHSLPSHFSPRRPLDHDPHHPLHSRRRHRRHLPMR